MKLLVTGFGPFPRVPRNPSAELARRVAASPRLARLGVSTAPLVLTTAYRALEEELLPALRREQPDAVLMIGVAARRSEICLETRALNRVSRLFPDACGCIGAALALERGAPHSVPLATPIEPLLRALRGPGSPVRASRDAGRYLCNAAYFRVLQEMRDTGAPVVFIHIPLGRGAQVARRPAVPRKGRSARPSAAGMERALVRLACRLVQNAVANRSLSIILGDGKSARQS